MSAPAGLPSWDRLLDELVKVAKQKNTLISSDERKKSLEAALLEEHKKRNYWVCFQLLEQLLGNTTYHAEIRERLDTSSHNSIPEGYLLLWEAKIQGMISFNLDQFSTRSYSQKFPGHSLDHFVGYESKHLGSVLQRSRPFVGNVHGVIDNASTWIFTHDKLNQLLSDPGYRQFVQGCLLSRTVFFVGVSADDVAVQTHLESIQRSGISGITHYWLTTRNDASTDKWSEQFNIRQILYSAPQNDHSDALECLRDLAKTSISQDPIVQDPILPTARKSTIDGPLPSPDELVVMPLEKIRSTLNGHAITLLRTPNDDAYKKYEEFSEKYDEAIDRAWYVTAKPPKNQILGYSLKDRISQGSFGDVFEADSPEGKRVALKLLRRDVRRDPAMLQAFRRGVRSMRILRRRSTPGMVEFLEASEIPAFVAMEWIEGPNLATAVESKIVSDWRSILRVGRDLSQVIYRAHTLPERVLHRDIRPPNVMFKDYWTNGNEIDIVVMDFDLSWHVDALEKSIVAKPLGFMAPEQLHRRPKESTRSALVDSFGFGMTMYFMLTSEIPVPDQQKHRDWESTLHNRIRSKVCPEWKSVSYRVSRLIQGSTQDQQRNRWDFAKIVSELKFLYEAIDGNQHDLPIDYHAEEIAAHAETMLHYSWDDSKMAAVYRSGGLTIEVSGYAPGDEVRLLMEWKQTGEENWKLLPKTGAQVKERARPSLEKHGWEGTTFDASYGLLRVSASASTRAKLDASHLAKGIDMLVHVMLPKN
ncbi:protein kinase [Burkholderia multivorans]|uniref:protein kinase domain-containing protein n=1 Tax=Burkholderia multivorans TaxID=87883 RepID=UPI001C9782DC|nr:protein kinase [Burkholderia multivorans]MBY4674798.1 protein kinase [Burkholderia multivorans]